MIMKKLLSCEKFIIALAICFLFLIFPFNLGQNDKNMAFAMPFYDLQPKEMVLRSSFFTSYSSSSEERKDNIKLASRLLDNCFLDIGEEFSFNKRIGERTEKRGFKEAKVIVGGEFVDGIGGGVCQVSSTLYNAALLSGLEISEFHAHSLPVSYVAPSFDAMVNSSFADLRFINNTKNPIIINSFADDNRILIEIYGEKLDKKIERLSIITEIIPPQEEQNIMDENGEYPELFRGQSKIIKYGKNGYKSQGFLLISDQKGSYKKMIRTDKYNATRGLIIWGTREEQIEKEEISEQKSIVKIEQENKYCKKILAFS